MPLTTIRTPPLLDSFTPLADHQSQTPTSFFSAKPVLHYHATGARALIPRDQVSKSPILHLGGTSAQEGAAGREPSNGDGERTEESQAVVDVFVGSESLTLFNNSISTGLSIPYPTITLHAIQRLPHPEDPSHEVQGLYMQLELETDPSAFDDDEPETFEITLLPPASPPSAPSDSDFTKALFDAVSACSNLHPDPISQEDEDMLDEDGDSRIVFEGSVSYEGISGLPGVARGLSDGGLPPPFPGSGGWITAENVGEYFDEEGNWIGGGGEEEALREGAGRVRGRDEVDGEEGGEAGTRVNGHGKEVEEEHKRPRIE